MKLLNKYIFIMLGVGLLLSCENEDQRPFPYMEELPFGIYPEIAITSDNNIINLTDLDNSSITIELGARDFEGIEVSESEIIVEYVYTRPNPNDPEVDTTYVEQAMTDAFSSLPVEVDFSSSDILGLFDKTGADLQAGDVFNFYPQYQTTDGQTINQFSSDICNEDFYQASCGVSVPVTCPIPETDFAGTYVISDDCGYFKNLPVTVEPAGATFRSFEGEYAIGTTNFGDLGFTFNLVCDQVFVDVQSIGIGCQTSGPVSVTTASTPATFDINDDSSFTVNVFYNNPDCFGGFECTLTFTKQ